MRALISDLDGTLYRCPELRAAYEAAMVRLISERTGYVDEAIGELGRTILGAYERAFGWLPPVSTFLGTFGISLGEWHRASESEVDPAEFLAASPLLEEGLRSAAGLGIRLAVVTNNSRLQTERTLTALGLAGTFSLIETPHAIDELKPGTAMYLRVLEALAVSPESCLVVGDRDTVDLVPARRLGMVTRLVTGPDQLLEMIRWMMEREGGRQ